jgi:sulfite dehydrogenase (quinone) subunit SoeC
MHPALSIVFFTTASGAGFALLGLLGLLVPLGLLPLSASFGFAALAVAVVLAAGGLASSVLHLGRPERAWRAFSQWRSSWLSREGVFSVLTFLPGAIFGIGWVFFGVTSGLVGLCGILAAALAAITIYCTGMIYASLKPIHQWHNAWVPAGYLALSAMSGALWLNALLHLWGAAMPAVGVLAAAAVVPASWVKLRYWRFIDTTRGASTPESATGLGARGKVRFFEAPHTEENYLLQEMGYRIARKHRLKLRQLALALGFIGPFVLTALALATGGAVAIAAALLAALLAMTGLLVERWLFFAEARHTVTLYYGAETV